eukprot:gene1153-1557_t
MKKLITSFCAVAFILMATVSFGQVIKGTYAIKNMQTGLLLRIKDANTANGTPLVAYHPVNWKCMTWNFNHVQGQTYQLKNLFSSKTFQPKTAAVEGVALEEQPLINKQASQQYEFILIEKNVYKIKLKGTELYVTPSDTKGSDNSQIILAAKQDGKAQQWTIYEQNPDQILEHKIVSIIRGAKPADVVRIANALYEGGIRLVEITLNSDDALNVIKTVSQCFKDKMLVGAGTVLDAQSAIAAIDAGAQFIISPSFDAETIKATLQQGAVSIPG